MTIDAMASLVGEHWVLMLLVLCPIVVVTMALAALNCEACGAPFGIFRRRNRTIDLCVRCALLHDIRRAKETGDAPSRDRRSRAPEDAGSKSGSEGSSGNATTEERRRAPAQDPRLAVR
jgi:hypothetical protein